MFHAYNTSGGVHASKKGNGESNFFTYEKFALLWLSFEVLSKLNSNYQSQRIVEFCVPYTVFNLCNIVKYLHGLRAKLNRSLSSLF